MRRRLGRALGTAALATVLAGCWPATNQGPDRAGHNQFERAITPQTVGTLTELWRTPGSGNDIVVAPNRVVVLGSTSTVGLDPATGAEAWRDAYLRGRTTGAFVDGDDVLVERTVIGNSTLRLGLATGEESPTPLGAPQGIRGDHELRLTVRVDVVALTGTEDLALVRRSDGTTLWEGRVYDSRIDLPAGSEYTLGGRRAYAAGGGLLSTEPGDAAVGTAVRAYPLADPDLTCGPATNPSWPCPAWVTTLPGQRYEAPVLSPEESTVYVATDLGAVHALDAATGAVRWTGDAGGGTPPPGPPALANGVLYQATGDGRLLAYDAAGCAGAPATACAPLWQADALPDSEGGLTDQPTVAGGVVVVGTTTGQVLAYDAGGCDAAPPSTCEPLWQASVGTTVGAVVVSNGRLHVAGGTNTYAFAPSG